MWRLAFRGRAGRRPVTDFAVPKSATVARPVYDLSDLTPLLHVVRVFYLRLKVRFSYRFWALFMVLSDAFYHIPLARSARHFDVLYNNMSYVFKRLPMGLKIAPSDIRPAPVIQ